eukprot:TRINITY_DN881_c0_g1_i7.p1 TRINITY_DN881_c0_g1~~TRINITY_DN881_c0_g1_i7.p1  ORF type:complete len:219 (+),score=62.13 TRINITY_DN881_c0_g1_i7:160-816(+)
MSNHVAVLRSQEEHAPPEAAAALAQLCATLEQLTKGCPDFHLWMLPTAVPRDVVEMVPRSWQNRKWMLNMYFNVHAVPLTQATPYVVPWSSVALAFIGTQVPPSQSMYALNGEIVGLCVSGEDQAYTPISATPGGPTGYPVFIMGQPPPLSCLGLGLVWAIDTTRKQFFIVTPVPPSQLRRVNVIAKGPPADVPENPAIVFSPLKGTVLMAPYVNLDG